MALPSCAARMGGLPDDHPADALDYRITNFIKRTATSSSAQLPERATWLVPNIPYRPRCNRPTAARASGSDLRPRHREEPAMAVYATHPAWGQPAPEWLSLQQAAAIYGVSVDTSAAASPPASFRRHASARG
jgi:hypothetical protein